MLEGGWSKRLTAKMSWSKPLLHKSKYPPGMWPSAGQVKTYTTAADVAYTVRNKLAKSANAKAARKSGSVAIQEQPLIWYSINYSQWCSKQKCRWGQDPKVPPLLPEVPPPQRIRFIEYKVSAYEKIICFRSTAYLHLKFKVHITRIHGFADEKYHFTVQFGRWKLCWQKI